MPITIEEMIEEGSMTAKQAMFMSYRWDAIVAVTLSVYVVNG